MNLIETILLSVSLAIDCFTVSVTSGIILHRIQWGTFLRMAFFFGLFQALMPFLGWLGASRFQHLIEAYDHWIAFAGFKQLESLWMPLTSIGIASFVLSLAGSLIGVFFGKRFHLRVEIFGGLVLIGIGIKILVEHLFLQ